MWTSLELNSDASLRCWLFLLRGDGVRECLESALESVLLKPLLVCRVVWWLQNVCYAPVQPVPYNWKLCVSSFLSLLPSTVRQQATSTSSGCWEQTVRSGCGSWVKALATSPMKRSPRSWLQREHACKHRERLRSSGERCWLGGYWVEPEPRALGRHKLGVEKWGAGQCLAVLSSVKIN